MDATIRRDERTNHFIQGVESASLDGYVRTVNDKLFNPEATIERVSTDLQVKFDQFEGREYALRERFRDAMG